MCRIETCTWSPNQKNGNSETRSAFGTDRWRFDGLYYISNLPGVGTGRDTE